MEKFMSLTAHLADFVVRTGFKEFSGDVVEKAKECFLDWAGSCMAGSDSDPVRILLEVVKSTGGSEEATILAEGTRYPSAWVAMVNGASSHVVEMDDVHRTSVLHPAASIIPAALAVAEREGSSGKELIEAIVLGYEVGIRVGEAAGTSHYRYWHTTGTCGTFGAAAAAGRLMGLSREEMVHVLGNAGTQASGLWEFLSDGAMSKQLHPAKAAFHGVFSADLARRGFTGAKEILEGEKGFCLATSSDFDLSCLVGGLGEGFRIMEVSFKPYAACRHIHPGIDAILEIQKAHNCSPDKIETIDLGITSGAFSLLEKIRADTPYAAKFSIPFCIAVAIVEGNVGLEQFSEETLRNAVVRDLMRKVKFQVDHEIDQAYPREWGAKASVMDIDGNVYVSRVAHPRGDPENPLSREELEEKFVELSKKQIKGEQAKIWFQAFKELDTVENIRTWIDGLIPREKLF